MRPKFFKNRPLQDILLAVIPSILLFFLAVSLAIRLIDPAPPMRIVISTGSEEGDYQSYAKLYQGIIQNEGITVDIRPSSGAAENLKRLQDPRSDVEVGFVQDGLGSPEDAPDLSSLGSIGYEPLWIFYRSKTELTRLSQLTGKRIALGRPGGGTRDLSLKLLRASGVDRTNSQFLDLGWQSSLDALKDGSVDAAFFLTTTEDPFLGRIFAEPELRLMNLDQAEAITRQIPFLHHLVLPHGALNLARNFPAQDTHLLAPTATLLVKDSLHPSLAYLLLKAASEVHGDPGIFEKKGEFPANKDNQFPLSDEAKLYYKSGIPFLQKYLPFWISSLLDRYVLALIPFLVLIFPMVRLVPKVYAWRIRSRIYQRYGELMYLETRIRPSHDPAKTAEYLQELDGIEERVNEMRIPLEFSEHRYSLRQHIDFVRERLRKARA